MSDRDGTLNSESDRTLAVVLWLYHVEEYTHPEIAAMTGKSVSFSKSQVARGGVRLRALLEPTQPKEAAPCLTATAH